MNYDRTQMAATYNQAHGHSPDVLRLWLDRILAELLRETISEIVALGCGTSRFSVALAETFDAKVIGIDLLAADERSAAAETIVGCLGCPLIPKPTKTSAANSPN